MNVAERTYIPEHVRSRAQLDIKAGDTVRVWSKIEEKGKTRLQQFEGLVLARKHGTEPGATFTVRKTSGSIGVERIFPLYSPVIDTIEVIKRAKTRRSKLYYIRDKATREIRRKLKQLQFAASTDDLKEAEPIVEPEAEE